MNLGRFAGDGRIKLQHIAEQPKNSKPMSIRRGTCKAIINSFESGDYRSSEYISRTGGTLWVISEYCDINQIPYTIESFGNAGWRLVVIK